MANPKQSESSDSPPAGAPEPEALPPPREALVISNADGIVCRPPIGAALHTLGRVVIGNWVGHVDGKPVTVEHGTPLRGLPAAIAKRVQETPDQRVGPFDARKRTAQVQTGLSR